MRSTKERQILFRKNVKAQGRSTLQTVISGKARAELNFIAQQIGHPINLTIEKLVADAVGPYRDTYERVFGRKADI